MYRGEDWAKVIEYCSAILGEGANFKNLLRNYAENYIPLSSNAMEYMKLYTNYSEPAILLLTNAPSMWFRGASFSRYGLSLKKINEIYPNPEPVCGGKLIYPTFGSSPHYMVNKFAEYFKYAYPGAAVGIPYVFCPALRCV